RDQALRLVHPQRLGMHLSKLRRHGDHVNAAFMIDVGRDLLAVNPTLIVFRFEFPAFFSHYSPPTFADRPDVPVTPARLKRSVRGLLPSSVAARPATASRCSGVKFLGISISMR